MSVACCSFLPREQVPKMDFCFSPILQIAKAIESAIPQTVPQQDDGRKEELREMEEKKAAIDRRAEAGVRRELWCGLGLIVAQTVGFMRLTFWDLSWDVMEPICFYVTSIYFMAGYGFFLRTSREPSFEGFFQSRFAAKQKRLMKACNFDLGRFNQLRSAALPIMKETSSSCSSCSS
ncbi:calcium uniporter protein 2, mitochondrial-like [Iris pallida]|uniref:Calcium uniporter protein 2, mitochondrial-like n=1 Tax=Iris pallida TaxID=29817 RepID=A0AAX6INK2_IRIPA|nr:calcium uniporter protein 2, mitochondrial-like [Iris pallida]